MIARNGLSDRMILKKQWYYLAGFLFFLAVQCYGIWYLWYGHPGPVGLDDAGWYMSGIEFFREFPFISTGDAELTVAPGYNLNKITHPLLYGWLSRLFGVSSETMFHWNFYIGLFLMAIVLLQLFRKTDDSPWFVLTAFVLFAFYEGKGSYHGFSWVTPSFYALALFLAGIVAFFYSRRPFIYGLPLILLLLLTHSTGIYLAAILLLSYSLNESFSKQNFKPLIAGFVLASIVVLVFLTGEYLYQQQLIPASFTSSFQAYHKDDMIVAEGVRDRFSVAINAIFMTLRKNDFNKYFYGLYTPLLVYGLYQLVRQRKLPVVWLLGLLFTGLIVASPLTKYPMRFFYPLEVMIWIVIAYGISMLLRRLFGSGDRNDIGVAMRLPIWMQKIAASGMIVIAVLFLYNAIHQKAHHTTYVKYSNTRFFDKERFLDFMKRNPARQFVVFTQMHDVYLSYAGMWRNPQLLFPHRISADSVLASPDRFIIIGENHRYFDKGKQGVQACVPYGCSLAISTGELKPGRYRLELIDTGLSGVEGLALSGKALKASTWQSAKTDIHYPKLAMTPPLVMPWYLALDKSWPLFRRPIRANDVVRESTTYSVDFELDEPLKTLTLVNNGDDLLLTGVIRIVDLGRGGSQEFDLDWGDERMLKNDLGLIHEGRRLPLLWTGAYPWVPMTLEKNFRDVKAFSVYAPGWPEQ